MKSSSVQSCDNEQAESESMSHQLGVAILKIFVLGPWVKKVDEFHFVDAPSAEAVDMAITNLVQLGAITLNSSGTSKVYELTEKGRRIMFLTPHAPELASKHHGCSDEDDEDDDDNLVKLYHGNSGSSPVALLGAGAEIRHLELERRYLIVDAFHSNDDDDKLEIRGHRVTFLTPDAPELTSKFHACSSSTGSLVNIIPFHVNARCDNKLSSCPPVDDNDNDDDDDDAEACSICLCEIIEDDMFELEACGHRFCRQCLVEQFESAIRNQGSFPICCAKQTCQTPILVTNMRYLLSSEKLDELFRASMRAFVASSNGTYRFCPSPDCPSVYRVASPDTFGEPFMCGACYLETCTRCHLEYHPYISCEQYKVFKEDPDSSLNEWRKDKEDVKDCPVCMHTIEKIDGCNHIQCRCGSHICWICMEPFDSCRECYMHFKTIHNGNI